MANAHQKDDSDDLDPGSPQAQIDTVRVRIGEPPPPESPPESRRVSSAGFPLQSTVAGTYRVEAVLGRGGMGTVYLVYDKWLDRHDALKVIAPPWLEDPEAAANFNQEARALAKLKSPHVVKVHIFGQYEDSYYFVMEYVRGRSLRAILAEHEASNATLPLRRTITILSQIAEGLETVHAAGLIHRDVKPSNIIIQDDTGLPVLVDFGLAVPGELINSNKLAGTPQYMAPEQIMPSGKITPRTDIYSLGCVAFELLTGQRPFRVPSNPDLARQVIQKPAPLVSSIRPELAVFDDVIARALAKTPEERFASVSAFRSALVDADARLGKPIRPARDAHKPSEPPPMRNDGKLHVLVIDDDPVFRKIASSAVQFVFQLNVVVATAASGLEAIERAERDLPDIVLLDYDMPGLNGAETLSHLRAMPGGDRIRVLVMSGWVSDLERSRFSALGVKDFLVKPIENRQLAERVSDIAKRLTRPKT